MTHTVKNNQCLMDIAIQRLGDASGVFSIAFLNEIGVTDRLAPGTVLRIPDTVLNDDVAAWFADNGYTVATEEDGSVDLDLKGIGYWRIEQGFKVS